jgi:capsular polysaccharide biosynthesis protein
MRSTLAETLGRAMRRWWLVAVLGLVGLAAGAVYAAAVPRTYSASSFVTVVAVDPANSQAALGFAQAYGRIAVEPQVLGGASAISGIPTTELLASASSSTSPDAPLIEITTRSPDAVRAANGATAIAGAFAVFGNTRTPDTGMRVAVLSDAAVPVTPSSASTGVVLAIGAGAGVILGVLLVAAGVGYLPERRRAPAPDGAAEDGEAPRRTVALEPMTIRVPSAAGAPVPHPRAASNGESTTADAAEPAGEQEGESRGES